jgi:excisionase family DNA binding protein
MKESQMPEFTVQEVAVRLKVTPMTVRRWLKAQSLEGIGCDDRARCRIRESALAAFLDARHRGGVHNRPMRTRIP